MTPTQLRSSLKRLRLSRRKAATYLGVDKSAVTRWLLGQRTIPGPVEGLLRCWEKHGLPES